MRVSATDTEPVSLVDRVTAIDLVSTIETATDSVPGSVLPTFDTSEVAMLDVSEALIPLNNISEESSAAIEPVSEALLLTLLVGVAVTVRLVRAMSVVS